MIKIKSCNLFGLYREITTFLFSERLVQDMVRVAVRIG